MLTEKWGRQDEQRCKGMVPSKLPTNDVERCQKETSGARTYSCSVSLLHTQQIYACGQQGDQPVPFPCRIQLMVRHKKLNPYNEQIKADE